MKSFVIRYYRQSGSDSFVIRHSSFVIAIALCAAVLSGCSSAQSLVSNQLAQSAVTAVAQYYGGAKAGEFAAAGLSAAAEVMQGYVDKKPPLQVAANSPGIRGVSQIVVDYLKTKGWITQATVDNLHAAAQIAANATPPAPNARPASDSTVHDGP